MAVDDVRQIRNVAIVGQGGAGKTSVADALLFAAGAVPRLGRVDEETSNFDVEPEEIRRRISITSTVHHVVWRKHEITLIDTPGYANFLADSRHALRAATAAVVVMSPTEEVKVELERIWGWLDEEGIPRVVLVSRMDRERGEVAGPVERLRERLGVRLVPLQMPLGTEDDLHGVVDLLAMRALAAEGGAAKVREVPIPQELQAEAEKQREALVEAVAEGDDELLERYLEGGELSPEELRRGLEDGVRVGRLVPVVCGAAPRLVGMAPLLDVIVDLFPSPGDFPPAAGHNPNTGEEETRPPDPSGPFSAFVFKTTVDPFAGKLSVFRVMSGTVAGDSIAWNATKGTRERLGNLFKLEGRKQQPVARAIAGEVAAVAKLGQTSSGDTLCDEKAPIVYPGLAEFPGVISFALEPHSRGDEEKATLALQRMIEEDPALHIHRGTETKEIIVSGAGQLHLDVVVERLKRKYNVEVDLKAPKIPYRETVKGTARAQGKLKKQTGGRGQYGDAWLEIEPLPRGTGFEFVNKIVGGVIPRQYIPAVEKGVREAMVEGFVAGYPMVDVRVTVYDGSYHEVDSSEIAFKVAGSLGFKNAVAQARPVLLEPVMTVEVAVPDDCMGDVIGDLNSRRGRIMGVEGKGGGQVIRALVPMAEILRYAPDLRSMTSGRGTFTMELAHYEEVPPHLVEKIAKEAKAAKGKER